MGGEVQGLAQDQQLREAPQSRLCQVCGVPMGLQTPREGFRPEDGGVAENARVVVGTSVGWGQPNPNATGSLFFGNRKTTGRGWIS